MTKAKHTDKEILSKGIRTLFVCLLLMFIGPTFLHIAFSNKEKALYIPLLIFAILLCIAAIYFLFKGIMTIIESLFNKK